MKFLTKKFLTDHNIVFTTTGKNASDKFYQTRCIFCNDSSNHLGWHRDKDYLFCWLCGHHSLAQAMYRLGIPKKEKEKYVILSRAASEPLKSSNNNKDLIIPGQELQDYHRDYLEKRGFDTSALISRYRLRGTGPACGKDKFRIIIPIFYNGQIVSYQGRDVTGVSEERYRACPKPKEIIPHKEILYDMDNCRESHVMVVEGIPGVWNLGRNVTACFGAEYTPEQVYLLAKFKTIFIYFDQDEAGIRAAKTLSTALDAIGRNAFVINNTTPADGLQEVEVQKLRIEVERLLLLNP